jgi:molybdenum cofactor cytidylyltransferase
MISGVILAAGRSARLGRPKQLLPLGGVPLLTHALRNAAASTLDETVLVLGHEAVAIAAAVGEWGQRVVINPDYGKGQSTSLRAGLGAVDPRVEAVVFLLGDQPRVGPAIIDAMIATFRDTGSAIVMPTYGGVRGNPVLLSRALFPELVNITGDQGARGVITDHRDQVITVPVSDGSPPRDVDTEQDYAALLADWKR